MVSLEELIGEVREGRLALTAAFTALGERGGVPEPRHLQEVAWLENLRDDGGLDPDMVAALLIKLGDLQTAAAAAAQPALAVGALADAPKEPTHSGTSSSMNTSTWQRVAGEAASEYATVGMLLKGRFLLERELGRGGMGVVYLARDERKVEARDRDPYVAVKVLNDEFRRHPDSLIALQRESRRSQQLAHDNIVRVYDFDKDGTIVFMTMEYIDGTSLKTLIREQAFDGMPLVKARPLIEGMAWALKRAHAAGVVHSDFKPGNVLVTRDGVAKVFDFGIARAGKQTDSPTDEQTLFDAGTLGALTPAYASLEMLRGADPVPADDIYGLGCVIYELLTGKHPFDKVSAEVALREGRKPPRVPGLSKRQNQTLQKAVAFERKQRMQDVSRLVAGLRDVGLHERVGRPLAYAVLCVLVLGAAGWGIQHQLRVRQMDRVAAGFQPGSPQHYADAAQAVAALANLDENERKQVLVAHGDQVQKFLVERLDAFWAPAKGRRDYASAEKVIAAVGKLGLYLPQVDVRRIEMDKQKYALDHPQSVLPAAPVAGSSAGAVVVAGPPSAPTMPGPGDRASSQPPAVSSPTPTPTSTQPTKTDAKQVADAQARMRTVAAKLVQDGEHNFAQQKYSAAIANAKAALQVSPDDSGAKQLLRRAQQAQQKAMHSIKIH